MTAQADPYTDRPTSFPWPPVLVAAGVLAGWYLQRVAPLPWPGLDDLGARIVGLGFGIAGVALAAWAAFTMWRHNTTVLPHRGVTALVTDGPFARWRNPIYIADVLLIFFFAELTKSMWVVLFAPVFIMLVTWLAILPEERHLTARFGDAYRDYQSRTKRWL